jgi:hypothetical protein
MATGVHEALANMLVENEDLEKMEAMKTLTRWITEKKYLRDLVGFVLYHIYSICCRILTCHNLVGIICYFIKTFSPSKYGVVLDTLSKCVSIVDDFYCLYSTAF